MAFGKISKQDLIDAGLDPDKLKEFQEKGVTKDDLATLKSGLETTVTDLIKNSFAELEGKLRPQPRTEPNNDDSNKNRQKTAEELEEERQTEFLSNPTGYVDKQVKTLGFAANVEFKKMSRDLAYKEAIRSMVGFNNATIKAEIDAEWNKYTPEKMAQFNTDPSMLITQIHDMVIGKHHNEIMQDRDKKDGKFNLVHSGGGGGGGGILDDSNRNKDNNEPVVTAEIEAQAKKFGMTGAEWLKEQTEMGEEEKTRFVKVGA